MEGTREISIGTDVQAIRELRERWSPEWTIWRSRGDDGAPRGWCATRRGRGRELSMTLMEATVGELEKALIVQSERPAFHD